MTASEHNDRTIFKVYRRLANSWHLSIEERCTLLNVKRATYRRWEEDAATVALTDEQILRVSFLVGIYDALHRIFGDEEYANGWLCRENAEFAGQYPLDVLLNGGLAKFSAVHGLVQGMAANL